MINTRTNKSFTLETENVVQLQFYKLWCALHWTPLQINLGFRIHILKGQWSFVLSSFCSYLSDSNLNKLNYTPQCASQRCLRSGYFHLFNVFWWLWSWSVHKGRTLVESFEQHYPHRLQAPEERGIKLQKIGVETEVSWCCGCLYRSSQEPTYSVWHLSVKNLQCNIQVKHLFLFFLAECT